MDGGFCGGGGAVFLGLVDGGGAVGFALGFVLGLGLGFGLVGVGLGLGLGWLPVPGLVGAGFGFVGFGLGFVGFGLSGGGVPALLALNWAMTAFAAALSRCVSVMWASLLRSCGNPYFLYSFRFREM